MKVRERRGFLRILIGMIVAVAGFSSSALASSAPHPIYVHMNGLNDFLPRVVFVRPGQQVVFVNEDTGAHSVHGYTLIGGKHLKDIDEAALPGMSSASAKPHTYAVRFSRPGAYYYLCTVHAHLVKVYRTPDGVNYFMPAKRKGIPGYGGTMSGIVIVTHAQPLLDSNPPITHQRVLKGLWNNGDVNSANASSKS